MAAVVLALSCTGSPGRAPDHTPPLVMLISLDTLRQDCVGPYATHQASVTPSLDQFAHEAVVFDSAWAPIPFTLPSHMTMFTSLAPDVHGVVSRKSRLSAAIPTLPEQLQAAGYRCFGLVSNLWMKAEFGFDRGFDTFERVSYGLTYADRIIARAFELIDSHRDQGPMFLFLHFIDAHSDFASVTENNLPYFASADVLRRLGIEPSDPRFCDDQARCATDFLLAADDEGQAVDPATIDLIRALYRGGIEDLDRQVGDLFAGLRQRNLWKDALIIVTADHGEEFRDHGLFIHVQPYVEDLAVPLMIRLPRSAHGGSRRPDMVELADIMPTMLDLLGLPRPAASEGRSLRPLLEQPAGRVPATAVVARDKKLATRYSLRTPELTLIHDFATEHSELYQRRLDPTETIDVAATHGDEVASLLDQLRRRLASYRTAAATVAGEPPPTDESILSPDEREKLRAIGYAE